MSGRPGAISKDLRLGDRNGSARLEKNHVALVVFKQFFEQILKLDLDATAKRREVKADQGIGVSGPHLRAHAKRKLVDLKGDLNHGSLRERQRLRESEQAAFGTQVHHARLDF